MVPVLVPRKGDTRACAFDCSVDAQVEADTLSHVHRVRGRGEAYDAIRADLSEGPRLSLGERFERVVLSVIEDVACPRFGDSGIVLTKWGLDLKFLRKLKTVAVHGETEQHGVKQQILEHLPLPPCLKNDSLHLGRDLLNGSYSGF